MLTIRKKTSKGTNSYLYESKKTNPSFLADNWHKPQKSSSHRAPFIFATSPAIEFWICNRTLPTIKNLQCKIKPRVELLPSVIYNVKRQEVLFHLENGSLFSRFNRVHHLGGCPRLSSEKHIHRLSPWVVESSLLHWNALLPYLSAEQLTESSSNT